MSSLDATSRPRPCPIGRWKREPQTSGRPLCAMRGEQPIANGAIVDGRGTSVSLPYRARRARLTARARRARRRRRRRSSSPRVAARGPPSRPPASGRRTSSPSPARDRLERVATVDGGALFGVLGARARAAGGPADGRIRAMESEARKLCDMGREFLDRGEPEEALRCYERAIDVEPENPDAWCGRGKAAYDLGRLERADRDFRRALRFAQRELGDPDASRRWWADAATRPYLRALHGHGLCR